MYPDRLIRASWGSRYQTFKARMREVGVDTRKKKQAGGESQAAPILSRAVRRAFPIFCTPYLLEGDIRIIFRPWAEGPLSPFTYGGMSQDTRPVNFQQRRGCMRLPAMKITETLNVVLPIWIHLTSMSFKRRRGSSISICGASACTRKNLSSKYFFLNPPSPEPDCLLRRPKKLPQCFPSVNLDRKSVV